MKRKAFSIIELLAVIGIVSLLLAILLPTLTSIRQQSKILLCTSRIRNSGTAVTMYGDDYRGIMPFAGRNARMITNPARENIRVGQQYGLYLGHWVDLMPEYWVGDLWTESMMCPDQPAYDPDAPDWPDASVAVDGFRRQPWFDMSAAFHLTPGSLSRGSRLHNATAAPQRLSNVAFPSGKGMLYEYLGFCIPDSSQSRFWKDAVQTQRYATSLAAVDGSAYRYARRNAFEPVFGVGIEYTMDGVLGRDIDHSFIGADAHNRFGQPNSWADTD